MTTDTTRTKRHHARTQAFQHVVAATVHAVAAQNHLMARALLELTATQSQLWVMAELFTTRIAQHLRLHQGDTLAGVHYRTEQGVWTFTDTLDIDGPAGCARTTAARLVCVIANTDPADRTTFETEWQTLWDTAADPETVTLAAAAMVAHTYPNLRIDL